jgi:predicted nucleic acid-binding protein
MPGVTYDTGMLIALERRKARALHVHERLQERAIRVTVPTAVVTEWWRGRTDDRDDILRSVELELGESGRAVAKSAGEALARVQTKRDDEECRCKLLVDAVVMASAALRGDVVYTSDIENLSRLGGSFPGVKLLAV